MNLRNLLRVSAVILMLAALAFLFVPQAATYADLDPFGLYAIQQIGASNLAIAVLLFLVSGMESLPARQAGATTVIVMQLASGIVHLLAVLGGVIPSGAGWFAVVFSLVFVLAFGYFRFIRPEAA